MSRALSASETAFARAALDWLLHEACERLCDHGDGPECLRNDAQSNFEIACLALEGGGLLRPEDDIYRVLHRSVDGVALPPGSTARRSISCSMPLI